jgi:hypothetical protein
VLDGRSRQVILLIMLYLWMPPSVAGQAVFRWEKVLGTQNVSTKRLINACVESQSLRGRLPPKVAVVPLARVLGVQERAERERVSVNPHDDPLRYLDLFITDYFLRTHMLGATRFEVRATAVQKVSASRTLCNVESSGPTAALVLGAGADPTLSVTTAFRENRHEYRLRVADSLVFVADSGVDVASLAGLTDTIGLVERVLSHRIQRPAFVLVSTTVAKLRAMNPEVLRGDRTSSFTLYMNGSPAVAFVSLRTPNGTSAIAHEAVHMVLSSVQSVRSGSAHGIENVMAEEALAYAIEDVSLSASAETDSASHSLRGLLARVRSESTPLRLYPTNAENGYPASLAPIAMLLRFAVQQCRTIPIALLRPSRSATYGSLATTLAGMLHVSIAAIDSLVVQGLQQREILHAGNHVRPECRLRAGAG